MHPIGNATGSAVNASTAERLAETDPPPTGLVFGSDGASSSAEGLRGLGQPVLSFEQWTALGRSGGWGDVGNLVHLADHSRGVPGAESGDPFGAILEGSYNGTILGYGNPTDYVGGVTQGFWNGTHQYQTRTLLRDAPREVQIEAFLSNTAPYEGIGNRAVDGRVIEATEGNPVRQTVDEANLLVTNTTLPGHMFHPGQVHRQLIFEGDDAYIVTTGHGEGWLPGVNNFFSESIWAAVDDHVEIQIEREIAQGE